MAGKSVRPHCALNLQEGFAFFCPHFACWAVCADKVLIDQLFEINEKAGKILC